MLLLIDFINYDKQTSRYAQMNAFVILLLAVGIPLAVLIFTRLKMELKNRKNNNCPEKYKPTKEDLQRIKTKLDEYLYTDDISFDMNVENQNSENENTSLTKTEGENICIS